MIIFLKNFECFFKSICISKTKIKMAIINVPVPIYSVKLSTTNMLFEDLIKFKVPNKTVKRISKKIFVEMDILMSYS